MTKTTPTAGDDGPDTAPARLSKKVKEAITAGLLLSTLLPPILLYLSHIADDPSTTTVWTTAALIMREMGLHLIPNLATVPLTIGTATFWLYTQLTELHRQARKGKPNQFRQEPGLHFAIAAIWAFSFAILLDAYPISRALENASDAIAMAVMAGIGWRAIIHRADPEDPFSSMAGRAKPAIQYIRSTLRRG